MEVLDFQRVRRLPVVEHQLDPYASESEMCARTNTSSSNPHFSYRILWSY